MDMYYTHEHVFNQYNSFFIICTWIHQGIGVPKEMIYAQVLSCKATWWKQQGKVTDILLCLFMP